MDSLTIEQEQEFTRDKKVALYLNDNPTIVSTYVPLENRRVLMNTHIAELVALLGVEAETTTGITTSKAAKKLLVATYYGATCKVCRAFLIEQNSSDADNFKISKTKLLHTPDGELKGLVVQINKWITDDLIPNAAFTPYGIDAASLVAGLALAVAFDESIGAALNVDSVQSAGSIAIENKLQEIKTDVDIADMLVAYFISSEPAFYNGFQSIKVIIDIGVHHTGMEGDVSRNGVPVKDATISCPVLQKSVKVNILGHYDLEQVKNGTYQFICTSPTFGVLIKTIHIKRGRIVHIDWSYTKVIRQANVAPQEVVNIDTENLHANPDSIITIEITGGPLRFFTAADPGAAGGSLFYEAQPGIVTMTLLEFATNFGGLDDTKPFLNVQNVGTVSAHFKVTFTNLDPA